MTREQLIEQGFAPLCGPYYMPREDEMLSRAVHHLSTGNDPYYLLWSEEREWVEVWTVPSHLNEEEGEA